MPIRLRTAHNDGLSPEALSRELRTGTGGFLKERRGIVGCALAASGAMAVIVLYQMGLIDHLPEPPLPGLDADAVDASEEAYAWLSAPDGTLGLATYAATAVLAAMGGADRTRRTPWLPLVLMGKTAADAAQAAKLTRDQWTKHGAFCSWCLTAAAASFGAAALAVPEARAALRMLRKGR